MKLTWAFIGAVGAFIGIWDFMRYQEGVAASVGSLWTISGTLHNLDSYWPLFSWCFVFALGVLTGHLFKVTPSDTTKKPHDVIW